jgi:hypothetical protein
MYHVLQHLIDMKCLNIKVDLLWIAVGLGFQTHDVP